MTTGETDHEVTVPDVVGLDVDLARRVASDAGLTLAQPDPDGPPLGALTWEQGFVVQTQRPAPGTRTWRHDSLVITWRRPGGGDPSGVREPRRPGPHHLDAQAAPPG
ncbi:PASTA domain-containing protein [Lapillicoccus jejuensis]|uniref:PASTA domain-containing protein n=1 Tax=Lapillicoccus jejuensis TaxID=402171 RepID=UPI001B87B12F|nr:PASTA domain-containing protein [Lapillicoccus jejuensis]